MHLADLELVDPLLNGAMQASLTANASLSDVPAECPRGNCTWPAHQSLAICTSVKDISDNLHVNMTSDDAERKPPVLTLDTPYGLLENAVRYVPHVGVYGGPAHFNLVSIRNRWYTPGDAKGLPINHLADVFLTYLPTCASTNNISGPIPSIPDWNSTYFRPTAWRALQGTFELCVLNMSSETASSTINTTILNRVDVDGRNPWTIDAGSDSIIWSNGDAQRTFNMSYQSASSLTIQFTRTLNESGVLGLFANTWDYDYTSAIARDVYGPDPFACAPEPLGGLAAFERRLQSIVTSLTNAYVTLPNDLAPRLVLIDFRMRRNTAGTGLTPGVVYISEQYIKVEFGWFVFPLVLSVLITLLVATTIIRTSFSDVPAWKSSTLPLLECMDPTSNLGSRGDVKLRARTENIQLMANAGTWYLDRKP